MNLLVPSLEVQVECFEGPLPLLISLIKKNKVDIFDIPIGLITERFLQYVELVRELNLRIVEDFIDMASLLIFIKSRMLLPSEDDPREELVEKIIEYEKIRGMAGNLSDIPLLGKDTFPRGKALLGEEDEEDLTTLCALFFQLMKSREEHFIIVREVKPTLEEKLEDIKRLLEESGTYSWKLDAGQELPEKVATVLAMLEITKLKLGRLSQRRPFGTITLIRR